MRSKAGLSLPPVYSAHVKNRCCIEDVHHTIHVIIVEREGGHPNYVPAGKPLVVERLEMLAQCFSITPFFPCSREILTVCNDNITVGTAARFTNPPQ